MPQRELTPDMKALLLSVRKRAFGNLNNKRLSDLVGLLDGWSAEKIDVFLQSDAGDKIKEALGNRDLLVASLYAPEGEERGMKLWCLVYDTQAVAEATRQSIVALQVPPDIKNKHVKLAVTNVDPVRTITDRSFGFGFDLLVRVKALRVTAANDDVFDVSTDRALGYGSEHGYEHFLTWAFDQTDLEAQVCALLEMEPHVQADQRPRDDCDVGSCGICTKQFKLKIDEGDALVNHGFQRPGTGYLVGKCFGVGYPPYELSSRACEDYIPVLHNMRQKSERLQTHLERFEGEEHIPNRKDGKGFIALTPSDSRFKAVRESHIRSVKAEIADMTAFEAELARRVEAWMPEPEKIRRQGQPPLPAALRRPKGLGGL